MYITLFISIMYIMLVWSNGKICGIELDLLSV